MQAMNQISGINVTSYYMTYVFIHALNISELRSVLILFALMSVCTNIKQSTNPGSSWIGRLSPLLSPRILCHRTLRAPKCHDDFSSSMLHLLGHHHHRSGPH